MHISWYQVSVGLIQVSPENHSGGTGGHRPMLGQFESGLKMVILFDVQDF
jgi:hypothetical protein